MLHAFYSQPMHEALPQFMRQFDELSMGSNRAQNKQKSHAMKLYVLTVFPLIVSYYFFSLSSPSTSQRLLCDCNRPQQDISVKIVVTYVHVYFLFTFSWSLLIFIPPQSIFSSIRRLMRHRIPGRRIAHITHFVTLCVRFSLFLSPEIYHRSTRQSQNTIIF